MFSGLDGGLCCKGKGHAYALDCSKLMLLGVPAQTQAPRLNVPAAVKVIKPGPVQIRVPRQQICAEVSSVTGRHCTLQFHLITQHGKALDSREDLWSEHLPPELLCPQAAGFLNGLALLRCELLHPQHPG